MKRRRTRLGTLCAACLRMAAACMVPEAALAVPELISPLTCTPGKECYVAQYFDHGKPGRAKGAADFTCGELSARGFRATDFIVAPPAAGEAESKAPVHVLAAEKGTVTAVRDGMQDAEAGAFKGESVRGRECGNAVILDHGRGYATQYCFLKRGSVKVKPGQKVERGATLGEAGRSGGAEVRGLRFLVTRQGTPVDPFTGEHPVDGSVDFPCGAPETFPLWERAAAERLRYVPAAVTGAGFAVAPPSAEGARSGKYRSPTFAAGGTFLVFWAEALGARPGHTLIMRVTGPDGGVIKDEKIVMNGAPEGALRFRHIVMRAPAGGWAVGDYHGYVRLESGGEYGACLAERTVIIRAVSGALK